MKIDEPEALTPKWDALVLVCKACRKRGSGPKDVKAKVLASVLRRGLHTHGVRSRIVLTGCLGLCPKKATTVTLVGRDDAPLTFAIRGETKLPAPFAAG